MIFIIVGVLLVLGTVFAFLTWLGAFTPKAPPEWSRIHPGMTRSEVLKLAGTPQLSGWPEKILETWELHRFASYRRLAITYDGERYGEHVLAVWEGTRVRGCAWRHVRTEEATVKPN